MDFEKLLELMCTQKASDLFITADRPAALKVDGKIKDVSKKPLTEEQSMQLVKNIMTQRQRDDFDNTKECNFAISRSGLGRFRVSAFTQRDAAGMVLRRIESDIPDWGKAYIFHLR
ncbi:twitching motility protein PilU [methanotrophic bacterial endosymbiont of Bathymodiolus sp.]|nr:twitching motility protein PilU [methanotrophic bacterial endosymbiont of Bathymodiolus sp.]